MDKNIITKAFAKLLNEKIEKLKEENAQTKQCIEELEAVIKDLDNVFENE